MGHELLNPIPLLSSERFQNLLDGLAKQYDYVIVDAARWAWSLMLRRSPRVPMAFCWW